MTIKNMSSRIVRRIAMLIAFAVVLIAPLASVGVSSAAVKNCGTICDGKPTSYVPAGHSVACANDGRIVKTGTPTAAQANPEENRFNDPYMQVQVFYSASCQTLWAKITNTRAIGRTYCGVTLDRFIPPTNIQNSGCAGAGTSVVTKMVDDNSPTHGQAASVELNEDDSRGFTSRFYFSY